MADRLAASSSLAGAQVQTRDAWKKSAIFPEAHHRVPFDFSSGEVRRPSPVRENLGN